MFVVHKLLGTETPAILPPPRCCWRCANRNKAHSGFDPELPQPDILQRYKIEYQFKMDFDATEISTSNTEDFILTLLKRKAKPSKLQSYLYCIRPLTSSSVFEQNVVEPSKRRIEFIFLACLHCKTAIKNHENIFVRV